MPVSLLSALQSLYAGDQYLQLYKTGIKVQGLGLQWVWNKGALCLHCSSLYIDDIGMIAEGVQGAVTGSEDVRVKHMLYADDLSQVTWIC